MIVLAATIVTIGFNRIVNILVLLGIVTAVGGGVVREVLLNRIPMILTGEIYASAAMIGAMIVVGGDYLNCPTEIVSIVGIAVCSGHVF